MATAERDAQELNSVATSLVTTAEADAARIRAEAEEARRATVAAAEDEAVLVHERAHRREEETESTARLLREQVADEVVRNRQTAQDELRAARQEAADLVTAARAEADDLRGKARAVLEDARAEAAVLTKRRDEIAAELEGLSGVIQALAVPTDPITAPAPDEKEQH
jgi:chromosome segregation ATPase